MTRNFASYPINFETHKNRLDLPYDDKVLDAAVRDPEGSRLLQVHDPVLLIRAAIGAVTERGASSVSDSEIYDRFMEGEFNDLDPQITKSLSVYMHDQGFFGIYN